MTPSGHRLAEERRLHHVVGGEAPVSIADMDQTVNETSVGAGSGLGQRDTLGRSWRTLVAVVGVALAAGTTCATAGNLPIVASTQAATPSATERPSSPPTVSSVHFGSERWVTTPQLRRSEAGIAWSLSPKVAVELNYERSALPPMMPRDHDDGFLTRLRIGF